MLHGQPCNSQLGLIIAAVTAVHQPEACDFFVVVVTVLKINGAIGGPRVNRAQRVAVEFSFVLVDVEAIGG